jgi:hypothetical protein
MPSTVYFTAVIAATGTKHEELERHAVQVNEDRPEEAATGSR